MVNAACQQNVCQMCTRQKAQIVLLLGKIVNEDKPAIDNTTAWATGGVYVI